MDMKEQRAIIDKVFDRIVKSPRIQDVSVSTGLTELTYHGSKAIANRLGCSVRTVARLMESKKLLYYHVYLGKRRTVRTNETMLKMTFAAWHSASVATSAKPVPKTP